MPKTFGYEYEFEQLDGIWKALEPADLRDRLRRIRPNLIAPYKRELRAEIIPMFRRAGFVSDGPPEPTRDLVVFRGELEGRTEHGISWTADRKTAIRYMGLWSPAGAASLLTARAPFGSVLARFTADDEVVVDAAQLLDIRSILRMPPWTNPLEPPVAEPQ